MKFRKITAAAVAALLAIGCMTACKNSDRSSAGSDSSPEESSQVEKVPQTDEEWHQAMIDKAMTSYGATAPMMNKIRAAQNGEEVTIAYIGGSITEGLTAGADDCYAKLTYNYFSEKFGTGDNVKYVNAGLSGTPSKLGVLRLNRDVIQYNPDIVFIEFAVNDGNDHEYQGAYESMVRRLLKLDNDVAVVLVMARTENGHTAQDYMKAIGEFYKLPIISYADALTYMFDNGKMTWKDFSDDQSHPNKDGHKLVAEMIDHYFDTVSEQPEENAPEVSDMTVYTSRQETAELFERPDLSPESIGSFNESSTIAGFKNGWTYQNDGNNSPAVFNISGKFIYMIFKENSSGNLGTAHVTVKCGDEIVNECDVNGIQSSGWGDPGIYSLVMDVEGKDYTIEVKMAEGDEDKNFEILAFAATK